MTAIRGVPGAVDAVGAPYQNFIEDDRAMMWDTLGGRQGVLKGFDMTENTGSMSVTFTPGSALIEERGADIGGNGRGYHAHNDVASVVSFDPPDASARNDAVVFAWADPQYGPLGAAVSDPGPQIVVVRGVPGSTTPRTDTQVDDAIGPGGWFRYADVQVDPADTEINPINVSLAPDRRAAPPRARVQASAPVLVPHASQIQIPFDTVAYDTADAWNVDTYTTPRDGCYSVLLRCQWSNDSTSGRRQAFIYINGVRVALSHREAQTQGGDEFGADHTVLWEGELVAGDTIQFEAWQNSGIDLDLHAVNDSPTATIRYVAPPATT